LILLGMVWPVWAVAMQSTSPVSADEYWSMVEHARQVVTSLNNQSNDEVLAGLDSLASEWEAVTGVRLESGELVTLDNTYLVSLLRAEKPDLNQLKHVFEALRAAHSKYPAALFTSKNLQPLEQILARPEFQWKEQAPNPINNWFQKLWDRFAAWLDKLFPDKEATVGVPGGGISIWMWLTVLLLVLILAYVFRGLFADLVSEANLNGNGDQDEVLTADAAFQRAQSLSRGGDYRAAVRYLYLSSLLLLDERGLLRYDRTRTNREYLRTVADQPELSQPLAEVIDVFDNVWYGYHELDEDRFKHYSDRVEELKEKKG
jgi:hypothetical protein